MVERRGWRDQTLSLLDLGTGTGCILVTLLAELPRAQGLGTDLSPSALALAAANARPPRRAARAPPSWPPIGSTASTGKFDLVLSNPPYLASGEIAGLARGGRRLRPACSPLMAAPMGLTPIAALPQARLRSWPRGAGCWSKSAPAKRPSCRIFSATAGLKLDPSQAIEPRPGRAAPRGRLRPVTGVDSGRKAKKGLENPYVQVRFVASERLYGHLALGRRRR